MADPIVSLDVDRVAVEPGGQASVTIKIINPGAIVEGYRVEVVGEGVSDWGEALPPEISIYPQQDATATVVFSPPGGTGAPGGTWPFGIRVRSTEDVDASAVVEGDLEIGKVFGLQATLLPVNSSGRWRGRHVVRLSNWGNTPARLKLTATDVDDGLGFMIRPEEVELALGGTSTAMLWVRTKTPRLRGTTTRIPFTVTGERVDAPAPAVPASPYGGAPDRPTVDGAFHQKPIITSGAIMLLALVLVAVGGGVAWALTRQLPPEATFAELGPPESPREVRVAPVGPDSVEVRWAPVPNVEGYTVVQVLDGSTTGSRPVPGTDTATTIDGLAPATTVCFAVQSRRGDLASPFGEKQCAATPAAPATAGPSPTGAPVSTPAGTPGDPGGGRPGGGGSAPADGGASSPPVSTPETSTPPAGPGASSSVDAAPDAAFKGKWFAADWWPAEGTTYDPEAKLAALKAVDDRAGIVQSRGYPNAVPRFQTDSWVLYLGPVASRAEAEAACATFTKVQPFCRAIQLDP